MNKDQILQAIMFAMPTAKWRFTPGLPDDRLDYNALEWEDVTREKPSQQQLTEWFNQSQITYSQETDYREQRRNAYPTAEEQLEMIFKFGIDGWKERIQAVKDTFPKPF